MAKVRKVAASAGRKDCRVERIDTYIVDAKWRNFVFAHVHTDDGISGIGEGSCEWQPTMVAAGIETLAKRVVVGQSAFQIEKLWQEMFRNEFARGSPLLNSAIGAIEQALWDIVGKALDRPVYDLLGGRLLPGERGPVAQFMYADRSGKRLTLYVARSESGETGTAFRFSQEGAVGVFYWVDRSMGYALSAELPRDELLRVADAVYAQIEK